MLTQREIWSEFQENYRYAHDYWSPFVSNAQVYTLASSGYTWSNKEREQLDKEGREPLELNIMRRPLEFFSGYLRDNLNSIVFAPVEGSDQRTADQLTKLSYYVWDKGEGYSTFLDAADEDFKAGMSLCGIQMDYSKDFVNGDISFYKRCFNQFYLDPTFERVDLRDNAFAVMRDLLDRNVIKQLLPFVDPKEIDNIQNAFRDDKFLSYHPNFTTLSRNRNLMAYDQYYKRTTRRRKFLVDQENSYFRDITDLDTEQERRLRMGLRRLRDLRNDSEIDPENLPPMLEVQDVDRPYIELHIMLNGQEVYCGEDKTGITETYPFVPLICFMEPSIWMPSQRIQGIAATQYSNQRNFNKRHMKIVDMMDSDISTGFQYMIGAVADAADLQQSGQNKIIGLDPEDPSVQKFGQDSVKQLQGGGANPALIEYQAIIDKLSLTLANVNESVLGIDDKGNTQVSGRLAQVRIAQGLRANRKIMDNIEQAQKILGAIVGQAIQLNYPPGKVKRILGEEPTEQFYNREFEQYDAVVKEGVRSQSQRDAYYYELVALKREGIVDVPQSEIVDALQMTGNERLKEAIEKQQQQQQQMAMQAAQVEMEKANADKEEKLALAQERRARVVSDLALKDERESEAQQNIAQAALDRAKTITEIAKMRDDRILQVLQFVNQLEQQEAAGREIQKSQVEDQADRINVDTFGSAENQQVQQQAQMPSSFQ